MSDNSDPIVFEGFSDELQMESDASADESVLPTNITHDIMSGRDSRSSSEEASSSEGTSSRGSSPRRMPTLVKEAPTVTSSRRPSSSDRSRDRSSGSHRRIPVVADVQVVADWPLNPPEDLHANSGAKDGDFLVPGSLPVRGRDFELDSPRILVEGGEAAGSRTPTPRRETRDQRRSRSARAYLGTDLEVVSTPRDHSHDMSFYFDRERNRFFPKVKRSVPEAPKGVVSDRIGTKSDACNASRDHSTRGSHGSASAKKSSRQIPVSIPLGSLQIPAYRPRKGSPPLLTSLDASLVHPPAGRKLKRKHSRSRLDVDDVVVGSANTVPDSRLRPDFLASGGLGGADSVRGNVSPPRRSKVRPSSSLGARPSSPSPTRFNRSNVSSRPATSSFDEGRDSDASVGSVPPNSASMRLRELMEVVSPIFNPDLFDPPTLPKARRAYGALSQLAVGHVADPRAPLVLGQPSRTRELTAALNGVQGLGRSGKWVTESALPYSASRFGTNTTHVPVRSKFQPPPLLLKRGKAEKPQLDYLSLQEKLVGQALSTSLHLAATATAACEKMVRIDVPPDVQSLIRGQAVMIESLLGDLFPAHANLTLRQRDVLLEDVKLPDKERESLRALPLFDKELFPTDFQALDERVTDKQLKLSSSQLFTQMLQKNTPSSAPAAKGTTSRPRKPKKQRQKPS